MSPVKEKQRQPRPGQHRSTMSSVSMTSVSFRDAKTQKNATHILSSAGHCAKNDWQIYANIRSQLHSGMWDSEPKIHWWARGLQHPFSKCFGRDWPTALESPSIFIGFLQKLSLIRPSSTKSDSPRQFDVSCLLYTLAIHEFLLSALLLGGTTPRVYQVQESVDPADTRIHRYLSCTVYWARSKGGISSVQRAFKAISSLNIGSAGVGNTILITFRGNVGQTADK